VTQEQWEDILEAFPREKFRDYMIDTLGTICRMKPQTTYDNFLSGIGERFVQGYNTTGKRVVDGLLVALAEE
jgi:hypothetical protein